MANNNHVIISSVIYKFSERVIVKLIAFVISIVLARMLEPETFGLLAIITVFTNFCQVFVQGGINVALIQSKEVNRKDYSTAFWISLVVAGITYAVLFFLAPYISRYYHTNDLIAPLRVLSICLVFCAYNSIQTAKMTRNMAFKKMFICSLITTIIAGTVGIIAAYKGFGLWALILYHLFTQIMVCITMFVAERWLPQFEFSIKRAKELFSYGWKILVSNLLYSVYTDIRALLIGRFYTTEDLAYYDRGNQFPSIVSTNLDIALQSVMLPTMSRHQDDNSTVLEILRRIIKLNTFIVTPLMVGIAVIAKSFTLVFLSEKWLGCVTYMVVLSTGYIFLPVSSSCNVAIKAIGRADVFMKNQAIRMITMSLILILTVFGFHSVLIIAIGYSIGLFCEMLIAIWPVKKYFGYNYYLAFKDIGPNIIISIAMGILAYFVSYLSLPPIFIMIIQIFVGLLSYIAFAFIFKNESINYIFETIKPYIRKR